jgi:hypothetical protein
LTIVKSIKSSQKQSASIVVVSMSYPVLRPKPSTHSMCAQESKLHTYRKEKIDTK